MKFFYIMPSEFITNLNSAIYDIDLAYKQPCNWVAFKMDIVKGTFLFYTQLNSVGWINTQRRLFQVSKDGQERDYLALVQPSFVMVLRQMEKKQQQPYYLYLKELCVCFE